MANSLLTPTEIAMEAVRILRSNMVAGRVFSRAYEVEFSNASKIGDTVKLRRRGARTIDEFTSSITIRDIEESGRDLVIEKHFDSSVAVTSKQQRLDVRSWVQQVVEPSMVAMAEKIDSYALSKIQNLPNVAGLGTNVPGATAQVANALLPGETPANGVADWAKVVKTLNQLKVPTSGRVAVLSPEAHANLLSVDAFVKVNESGTGSALRQAFLGRLMGVDTFMDQNVDITDHTTGTGYDMTVNGALAAGATTIAFDGMTTAAGTLKAGDLVNIEGYGNVVVAADATATAGAGSFTIDEPLREAVADDITMHIYDNDSGDVSNTWESHGAVLHPEAIALAVVPLDEPRGAEAGVSEPDPETGFQVRVVTSYDITNKRDIISFDVLVGAAVAHGDMGAQIIQSTA